MDSAPEMYFFASPKSISITTSVIMVSMAPVTEKSSPNSACCVASLIINNRIKSKLVICSSARLPAILNTTSKIR